MADSRVGSATWQDASYRQIQMAHDFTKRPFSAAPSIKARQISIYKEDDSGKMKSVEWNHRTTHPLNRGLVIQLGNTKASNYMRDTKIIMYHLRQAIGETERLIHRLQRERDILERNHANLRRDLFTNRETFQLRSLRPKSERHPDKVDTLLQGEKNGLVALTRQTELQLHKLQSQLETLYHHRQKLSQFAKEQNQVLDIISETAKPRLLRQETKGSGKPFGQDNTDCLSEIKSALETCKKFRREQHLDWYKPVESRDLKDSVTEGLRKKAEESAKIREDVILSLGNIRNLTNRQQRLHDRVETRYQMELGPECNLNLLVKEHLDRPLVKLLQRHSGTQLHEKALILQGAAPFKHSLDRADEKLGCLQITHLTLQNDAKNKFWGEHFDWMSMRLREKSARGVLRERLCL